MSVKEVFDEFAKLYPQYDMELASGVPEDVGELSAVDIVLFEIDHADDVFPGFLVEREAASTTYSTVFMDREVNIYVTNDLDLYENALVRRQHELFLSYNFPKLLQRVTNYKLEGMKTVPAWAAALELDAIDPYAALLKPQVLKAKIIEESL